MSSENHDHSNFLERFVDKTKHFLDNLNRTQSLIAGGIMGLVSGYLLKTFLMTFFVFWIICLLTHVLGYIRIDEDRLQNHSEYLWNLFHDSRIRSSLRNGLIEQGKDWTLEHKAMCISATCTFVLAILFL